MKNFIQIKGIMNYIYRWKTSVLDYQTWTIAWQFQDHHKAEEFLNLLHWQ